MLSDKIDLLRHINHWVVEKIQHHQLNEISFDEYAQDFDWLSEKWKDQYQDIVSWVQCQYTGFTIDQKSHVKMIVIQNVFWMLCHHYMHVDVLLHETKSQVRSNLIANLRRSGVLIEESLLGGPVEFVAIYFYDVGWLKD